MVFATIIDDIEEQFGRKWEVIAMVVLGNGIPNYGKVIYDHGIYKAFSEKRAQLKFKQEVTSKYREMRIVNVAYLYTQLAHNGNGRNGVNGRKKSGIVNNYYPRIKNDGEQKWAN